jgi:hypothetical protein
MNILFFQITNQNTKPYSDFCCSINKDYCNLHGYNYLEINSEKIEGYHYTWSKIFKSIELINETNYDFYFFLDADACVINKSIKIENIIKNMHYNICFSENGFNGGLLIATGGFIFNKKAKSIFEECIEISKTKEMLKYKNQHWFEMAIINYMYEKEKIFDVFEMNVINSYGTISVDNPDLPNLFVYHFQGKSDAEKTRIANELYNNFFKERV